MSDDRARFGEQQRELAAMTPAQRYSKQGMALAAEIDRAIAQHGRSWAGRVADLVDAYDFKRGELVKVVVRGDKLPQIAKELFGLAPIAHLDLAPPLAFDRVVAVPELAKLVSFQVNRARAAFGDREAMQLAQCKHAASWRWIGLWGNAITRAGVEALAASPYLERVVYLGLVDNPCDATPYVLDDEGAQTVQQPAIAIELERTFGARPWLTGPAAGAPWPPDRYAV
ncbi:MAG TPA: hypothetical protein VMJ10_24535 [Kofleriaceae bacterium]|nr:hypothetical protein [Kofleriaceae bacterium]